MDDLAAHIQAATQAARELPHDPGTPGETILANLTRIRRDTAGLEERATAAEAALTAAKAELARAVTERDKDARQHDAAHRQQTAELDQARATIDELRNLHQQKLGEIGATINEYGKTLAALSQQLLAHR